MKIIRYQTPELSSDTHSLSSETNSDTEQKAEQHSAAEPYSANTSYEDVIRNYALPFPSTLSDNESKPYYDIEEYDDILKTDYPLVYIDHFIELSLDDLQFGSPTDFVWHYTYHSHRLSSRRFNRRLRHILNSADYIAHEQHHLQAHSSYIDSLILLHRYDFDPLITIAQLFL